MNRREFVGFAALAPLASSAGLSASPTTKSLIVQPGSGRVYDIGGGEARILVDSQLSGGGWWLGNLRSNPGRLTSLHVHHSADEQFYSLEGVVSIWVDGSWHELQAGGLAVVPRGTPHALGNRSQESIRFLASGNPAGFEGFFADIEALARRLPYGAPEFFTELKNVYLKYDSELLGPPPKI
jgi:mannose-6-phosphate isomerase-like protein (cupin superfamily)